MIADKKDFIDKITELHYKTYAFSEINENDKWIFLVSHQMSNTGAPLELVYFAQYLKKLGFFPIIISMEDGKLSSVCEYENIPVIINPDVYYDRLIDSCLHLVSMVIINTIAGGPLIRRLNGCGHNIIWWIHESEYSYSKSYLVQLPVQIYDNIHIYCVGEYSKNTLLKRRPNYKCNILPILVPDELNRILKKQFLPRKITKDKTVFLHVGTLMKTKGQDILLGAINKLDKKQIEKSLFIFVGKQYDLDIKNKIDEYIQKYPQSIILLDEIDHSTMLTLYNNADCCLCTSMADSMPTTIIEAMMFSKIIICTENAGISLYIKENNCGLVYKNNDINELKQYISLVVDNKTKFNNMRDNARKVWKKNFSENVFVSNVKKLISDYSMSCDYVKKYSNKISNKYDKKNQPLITIILTGETQIIEIYKTIKSLLKQNFVDWELIIHKKVNIVCKIIIQILVSTHKIRYVFKDIDLCHGKYLLIIESNTVLKNNALNTFVNEIKNTNADFVYCDHVDCDKNEKIIKTHYKPDYSPDTLRSGNYIGHVFLTKKDFFESVVKEYQLQKEYFNENDFGTILALTYKAKKIIHIPKALYKVYNEKIGIIKRNDKVSLTNFLSNNGCKASVDSIEGTNKYKINYEIKNRSLVSIIICNKNHYNDLKKCIDSIYEKSTYQLYEIIIIDNGSDEKNLKDYYDELKLKGIKILQYIIPFNYSKLNNIAVKYAKGEYIVFLNNDTEIITPDWIENMMMYCQRSDVGIVGAKLLFNDNTIQHAGVAIGINNFVDHLFKNYEDTDSGYEDRIICTQNLSAVTFACAMIKKSLFCEMGGFDEEYAVTLNDTDLCLRIREKKLFVIWTPFSKLYHYESKSRGFDLLIEHKRLRCQKEVDKFRKLWKKYFDNGDPYYNINFDLSYVDCRVKI